MAGLTQASLAVALKTSNGQIGDKEADRSKPSYAFLLALEHISGCSAEWMLTGEGEPGRGSEGGRSPRGGWPITRASVPADRADPDPGVARDVGMAWSILESGKGEAKSLQKNIYSFYKGVFDLEALAQQLGENNLGDYEAEYRAMVKRRKRKTQSADSGSAAAGTDDGGAVEGGAKE